jgi:cysteine synthase
VTIEAEGVLKPTSGNTGTGVAVVLRQGSQHQLVVQAARLKPTSSVLQPSTGATGSTGTTGG